MPIMGKKSGGEILLPSITATTPTPVKNISVASLEYKDVAIDTKWTPIESIMAHVAGAVWVVEYYSQVIDLDSQLMSQAPTVSAVYQQYKKIKDLVIRVTSDLKTNQDTDTKMMQMDGSGIISGSIIPNEADMFVVDIGAGAPAVFRVTSSKKNTIFKEAVYEIEYALASTHHEYIHDLEEKTVSELVYRQDFLNHGRDPIVEEEESEIHNSMLEVYFKHAKRYFQTFFSDEYHAFLIPEMDLSTYDPFINNFIHQCFDRLDSPLMQKARQLSTGGDLACKNTSLWDALAERDEEILENSFTKHRLVLNSAFPSDPVLNGIRWSGVKKCVYPADPKIGFMGMAAGGYLAGDDSHVKPIPVKVEPEPYAIPVPKPFSYNRMYPSRNVAALYGDLQKDNTVAIKGCFTDEYYVLSHDFYHHTEEADTFERLVRQYLQRKELDASQLARTIGISNTWGAKEQFYFIPMLLIMIRSYLMGR
jgi:hypothetical protein